MTKQAKVDASGNITIPADVRHALALEQGGVVEFELTGKGQVTMRSVDREAYQRRYDAALANIRAVSEKYRHLRTGQTTHEYMAEIREPLP